MSMAKFIEVRDTGGNEYLVNTAHIYHIKEERDRVFVDRWTHKITLPDEVIEVTKPMFDKVKLEIMED